MSFRTIVINDKAKLSYKNDFMIVQNDEMKMVHLSEINTLLIESTMVQISTFLISELVRNKIKVIFCDEKHNPCGEILPYYSSYNTSKKIIAQTKWQEDYKQNVWTHIVANKISNQAGLLKKLKLPNYDKLQDYLLELEFNDTTNREAHSAKVYFNTLFGKGFSRDLPNSINAGLDYGYTILLSAFNRSISSLGYINPLGINHKSEYNNFNLGCDLLEPFRVLVDEVVVAKQNDEFNDDYKKTMLDLLNKSIKYNKKNRVLLNAIPIYITSVLRAVETGNMEEIIEYKFGV